VSCSRNTDARSSYSVIAQYRRSQLVFSYPAMLTLAASR
jgi:hypothetical protein